MFTPRTEDKNWGRVTHIFHSAHAAISVLEIKAGERCSQHIHWERANQFAVLVGSIVVEWWDRTLDGAKDMKVVTAGNSYSIHSRVRHRFRVIQSGWLVEVYWPDRLHGRVRLDDIERFDTGGPDDLDELRRELLARGIPWPLDHGS